MKSTDWLEIKRVFNAAIELPELERAAFLGDCPTDLRFEVEKLLNACQSAGDFIAEPALVELGLTDLDERDPYIGKQIDSYRIIREIGHGGMGTVYLGNRADDSFDKPVAIKLIKRGMDTTAVLKRFVMERQILAQLQHPNIASLLDGGTTADGLPYFVMEYVDGQPITAFCSSLQTSIPERLELFTKVCEAVSFAHQSLVVHRDIKPSNIVVTADGTPKLLDFGIAKLLHPEWSLDTNEATATMFRLMTPEYASPEQIRGLPITTASDVYSLGVVLYELLSGERPFKIESRLPEEVAQIVLTAEPLKPSEVATRRRGDAETLRKVSPSTDSNDKPEISASPILRVSASQLRGDLDNIVLKALRKEPERRYQSVQEFAGDIRRHLTGLPVTATADTTLYRLKKFVKRHSVGVLAAGLVVATLLVAASVTTWQAAVARRERDKAEHRFKQVRKLANTVLFEYHDAIAKLAGSTPLREKMIKDALEYLDNLAADNNDDASLQAELATAYEKVGDVQGNPYLANLGDQAGALASYNKALAIRAALERSAPGNPEIKYDLASVYEMIGDILWAKGDSSAARENYEQAFAIFNELERNGTTPDVGAVGNIYNRLGQTYQQAGDFDIAKEKYESSLNAIQALLAAEPGSADHRQGIAIALMKIGDVSYQQRKYPEASENYQRSFSILSELVNADPANTDLKRKMSLNLARLAVVEMKAADFSKAIEYGGQAVKIQKDIALVDPGNVQIQFDLADTLTNLGETYGRKGDLSSATVYFNESLALFGKSQSKNPDYAQVRDHSGKTYLAYAGVLLKNGRAAPALDNYRHARELLETPSPNHDSLETLAEVYEGMADALASITKSVGVNDEIRDLYQRSLDALRQAEPTHKLSDESSTRVVSVQAKLKKHLEFAARAVR
jgi:serine/threonine protein kinase/tetratricopeptide (TPR) repeat protein